MKLTCYALKPDPPVLRTAPSTRAWMDRIPDNHACRCLPLNIANTHGWDVLSPCDLTASWSGGIHARAIRFAAQEGYANLAQFAVSHFAFGIVTFHLGYLFQTEPGWDLFASGSLNTIKDGIAPLTGVIETDWLPYPFTMNWQMTRPGTVRFEKTSRCARSFRFRTRRLKRSNRRFSTSTTARSSRRRRWRGRSAATSS